MYRNILTIFGIILFSLFNYAGPTYIAYLTFPTDQHMIGTVIFWALEVTVCAVLCSATYQAYSWPQVAGDHIRKILLWNIPIVLGLSAFMLTSIHTKFQSVAFPFVFAIAIPVIEEVIFRGLIFEKLSKYSSEIAIMSSSVLFGLHHLQYYNFQISRFVVFQITYTLILGVCFANIRSLSKSIIPSTIIHMLINTIIQL